MVDFTATTQIINAIVHQIQEVAKRLSQASKSLQEGNTSGIPLRGKGFHMFECVLITSTLSRSRETAGIIALALKLPVTPMIRLPHQSLPSVNTRDEESAQR